MSLNSQYFKIVGLNFLCTFLHIFEYYVESIGKVVANFHKQLNIIITAIDNSIFQTNGLFLVHTINVNNM